jgi:hypothetical protein
MLKLFSLSFLNRKCRNTISERDVQMTHELFIALQGASPGLNSRVVEPESVQQQNRILIQQMFKHCALRDMVLCLGVKLTFCLLKDSKLK